MQMTMQMGRGTIMMVAETIISVAAWRRLAQSAAKIVSSSIKMGIITTFESAPGLGLMGKKAAVEQPSYRASRRQITIPVNQSVLIRLGGVCEYFGFSRNKVAGMLVEAGFRNLQQLYEDAGGAEPGILAILRHLNQLRDSRDDPETIPVPSSPSGGSRSHGAAAGGR